MKLKIQYALEKLMFCNKSNNLNVIRNLYDIK